MYSYYSTRRAPAKRLISLSTWDLSSIIARSTGLWTLLLFPGMDVCIACREQSCFRLGIIPVLRLSNSSGRAWHEYLFALPGCVFALPRLAHTKASTIGVFVVMRGVPRVRLE